MICIVAAVIFYLYVIFFTETNRMFEKAHIFNKLVCGGVFNRI